MARTARRERRQKQGQGTVPQLPWRQVDNPYPPMEPLSADQVEAIHLASLTILENLGIEVMGEDVQALFRDAGAKVDAGTGIVRLDRGLVEQALATAPPSFTLTPRNAERAISVGGKRINFGFVSGAPNVHDRIKGRRAGNMRDF